MTTLTTDASGRAPRRAGPPRARAAAARGEQHEVELFSGLGHVALAVWALMRHRARCSGCSWPSFKNNTEIFRQPVRAAGGALASRTTSTAWTEAHVGRYFLNSVFVVALSTSGTMLLRLDGRVRAGPVQVRRQPVHLLPVRLRAGLPGLPGARAAVLRSCSNLGLLNTYTGLILVYIAYSLPFTVFFLAAFFKTLPNQVAEAGDRSTAPRTPGCSSRSCCRWPSSGLVSITIFNIVGQWNQYLLPVVIMQGQGAEDKWVLTQGIANISVSAGYQANWAGLFAALTLSILPMIIVYAFFQRQIQSGLTAGAVKYRRTAGGDSRGRTAAYRAAHRIRDRRWAGAPGGVRAAESGPCWWRWWRRRGAAGCSRCTPTARPPAPVEPVADLAAADRRPRGRRPAALGLGRHRRRSTRPAARRRAGRAAATTSS